MHNQKRMFAVLIAAIVVVGCAVAVAGTDAMQGVALKQTINLTMPTVVGGTLLPQGEYKVNHEMRGTEHIMIFTKVGGKLEAKAKCNLVPLNAKAKTTEFRYSENAKNERVLTEMQFQGDTSKHILEP
jgi:hypothetical protein